MKISFMGTGGSIPVSNPKRVKFGGNTTCVRFESECLPKGSALVIDAGSGFKPLAGTLIKEKVTDLHIIFTHWHHDHTQGFLLAGTTYYEAVKNTVWGPVEHGYGGRKVFETLMQSPFFPIDFKHRQVASHISFRDLGNTSSEVLVVHPTGGMKCFSASDLQRAETNGKMLTFRNDKFAVQECLVIRMMKTYHPESTICYRFEERPTGKVFVFLTDHENTSALPASLRTHLKEADLLVMDCQYKLKTYREKTAGYGHATADYCVEVALAVGAKKLGLTHHDPDSTDDDIEAIVQEGVEHLIRRITGGTEGIMSPGQDFVSALHDYQVIEL